MSSPYVRTRHIGGFTPLGMEVHAAPCERHSDGIDAGFALLGQLLAACEQAWQELRQGIAARQSGGAEMHSRIRSFRLDVPLAQSACASATSVRTAVTDLADASIRIEFFGWAGDATCFASAIIDFEDHTGRQPVTLSNQARLWLQKRTAGVRCRRGSFLVPNDVT